MTISNLQEIYYIFKNTRNDFNEFYSQVIENNELRGCADYKQLFQALHETTEEQFVLAVYKFGFRGAVNAIYFNELD